MDGFGAAAPSTGDHKPLGHTSKKGEVFDASQYAFFGKNVDEEVELGGLEDEDEYKAMLAVEFSEDDLFINKEEAEDIRSLSDIDDLTTTFLKNDSWACGYYIMSWMKTIIRAGIRGDWTEQFNTTSALPNALIKTIREEWARYLNKHFK